MLTGIVLQSSTSVGSASEQNVPSVRKGGRGGGGNRNIGGGPEHSGQSALSTAPTSAIFVLNELTTTLVTIHASNYFPG